MLTVVEISRSQPAQLLPEHALQLGRDAAGWLLSSHAQVDEGPHRGGVYGCADRNGPRYVYGEITGYYLTYLSWLAANDRAPEIRLRVSSASAWIRRNWITASHPYTRSYFDGSNAQDWRNQYHFSFDLAMMLRGVVAARDFMELDLFEELVDGLNRHLARFVTPARGLLPCVPEFRGTRNNSWAVLPGPYQLKTAASILAWNHWIHPPVRRAAENLLYQWTESHAEPSPWLEPHPFLYSLEGLLLIGHFLQDRSFIRQAETEYADAVGAIGFREAARAVCVRSDVLAQMLRIGCLLKGLNTLDGVEWDEFLDELAARLASFQGPDGAVHFRVSPDGYLDSANTWSAMFASQALHFYGWLRQDRLFAAQAVSRLV